MDVDVAKVELKYLIKHILLIDLLDIDFILIN